MDSGEHLTVERLAAVMRSLEDRGAENINLVSPTHQAPQIFEAVQRARSSGMRIPVVYNCGGYENPGFLRELDGLVDIYMPDFKYGADEDGERFSGIESYSRWCRESLREMHRQVGDLRMDARGVARTGLLVRHLVLPRGVAHSADVIDFLASEISPNTYLNIMDQYRPCYRAVGHAVLGRRVLASEVAEAVTRAHSRGMTRVLC
jgi:putative pyruvate formate lyase activating enzyme